MDLLADVLGIARLGTTSVTQVEVEAPSGLQIAPSGEAHILVVRRGGCWLHTAVEPRPLRLEAGDVVLLRRSVGQSIRHTPAIEPIPYLHDLATAPRPGPRPRSADSILVLCAKYLLQPMGAHPLTAVLPPFIHLADREATPNAELRTLIQLLCREAARATDYAEVVVPRLVDALLVYVVRTWLEEQALAGGWFTALRDPSIAKALSLIHMQPEAAWSVKGLAKAIGQSRAVFARRFASLVGETPVAYLTRWRMCVASKLLAETGFSLEELAHRVGYESSSAFSKAFQRSNGCSPSRFRSEARQLAKCRNTSDVR